MIGNLWVGQIPAQVLSIIVNDNDGLAVNLNTYSTLEVRLLDPRNGEVDVSGSQLLVGSGNGRIAWRLPLDRSLFESPGEYLVQIKMTNAQGVVDYTDEHTILVRRPGGRK